MLQIFVDHHDMMTDFLKQILDNPQFKGDRFKNLESLTSLKLYNRLLECYLVKKQKLEAEIAREKHLMSAPGKEATLSLHAAQKIADVQKNINDLIKDKKKINKHYMLFLFKIYDSEDGI